MYLHEDVCSHQELNSSSPGSPLNNLILFKTPFLPLLIPRLSYDYEDHINKNSKTEGFLTISTHLQDIFVCFMVLNKGKKTLNKPNISPSYSIAYSLICSGTTELGWVVVASKRDRQNSILNPVFYCHYAITR